jgi:hypothetical protein
MKGRAGSELVSEKEEYRNDVEVEANSPRLAADARE